MLILQRANLSDEQLLDRAAKARWKWLEKSTEWPGSEKCLVTGWKVKEGHFCGCHSENKATYLRGDLDSSSIGFDHLLDCNECGHPIWLGWIHNDVLIEKRECFDCNFWTCLIEKGNNIVIRSGDEIHHYAIGPEKVPGIINGFAGRWHIIEFSNGRVEKTCDLWHNGEIPRRFWDRLPINAKFI